MPRNPNDHDDRVVNGLSVDRERRIDDILRRGRTMDRREELAQARVGQIDDRIAEIADNISGRADADVYAAIARETQRKDRYAGQKDMYESIRVARTNERLTSEVYSQMGSGGQASYVNNMSRTRAVNGVAMDAARSIPQSELEAHRSRFMNAAGGSFEQGLNNANVMTPYGEVDDSRLNSLQSARTQQMGFLNEVAYADAALRKQRQMGLDTDSRYSGAMRTGNRVERDLMSYGISQDIAAGRAPNATEARGQEVGLLQKFSEQMKALNEATDKTGPAFENLLSNLERTGDELEKNRELQRQLREGGGGGGGAAKAAGYMMMGGMGLQMASGLVGEIGLNQSNRQTGNRIAAAGEVNQLWDRRNAALRGDMSSLYMLTDGALGDIDAAGKFNRGMMQATQGLSMTGDVLTGGAYAIAAGAGVATPGGRALSALSGSGPANVANAASAFSSAAVTGSDLFRGVSANAEELAERQRRYQLYSANNYVTNQMREVAYGHVMGSRGSALALGGDVGQSYFEEVSGAGAVGSLGRMSSARISPEQFAALSAEGASQGSVFSTNSVYSARNLERAGIGTASQNMQRQNLLAAGGANNPSASLQSVLEVAFSKSLSSNAALNIISQSTSQLAQQSSGFAFGMDTTKASATILGRMADKDNPNKEAAATRAGTATDIINNKITDTSVSYANQAGIADIMRSSKVSYSAAERFKSKDDQTRQAIQDEMARMEGLSGNDRTAAERAFASKLYSGGLGEFVDPKTMSVDRQKMAAAVQAGRRDLFRSEESMGTFGAGNMPGYKQYTEGKLTEEEMLKNPQKYHLMLTRGGEAASRMGLTLGEMGRFSRGEGVKTAAGVAKAAAAAGGQGGGETFTAADNLATVSGADLANQAKLVAESSGNMTIAIKDWTKRTEQLFESLNQDSVNAFKDAAAKASKDFASGALMFQTSVNKFANSVGVKTGPVEDLSGKR